MAQWYDTRTVWYYTCDRCHDESVKDESRQHLDAICKNAGWRLHCGEDVCPDCIQAEGREEPLEPGETGIY